MILIVEAENKEEDQGTQNYIWLAYASHYNYARIASKSSLGRFFN